MTENKSKAVTENKSKAVTTIETDYPVLAANLDGLREVIVANIGAGGMSEFDLPRLKVPAGGGTSWEVETIDGTTQEETIGGIIIHWSDRRSYWKESFEDSGGGSPPDCSSADVVTGIGSPGGKCIDCPLAQFGSADKGEGQACKAMRLLFVLMPGDRFPTVVAVPPTSLKGVHKYFLALANKSRRFNRVFTDLGLEKDKNAKGTPYSKIVARPAGAIPDEMAAALDSYTQALMPHLGAVTVDAGDYETEAAS